MGWFFQAVFWQTLLTWCFNNVGRIFIALLIYYCAWFFDFHQLLFSMLQSIWPSGDLVNDLGPLLQPLCWIQGWYDVEYLLFLIIGYWEFVAVFIVIKYIWKAIPTTG